MAAPKGRPKPAGSGRQKGTVNKKNLDVIQKLAELNCDPLEGMAIIAKKAMESNDYALAGNMYKELAQYIAPKRKAIEHTGADGGSLGVTIIERVIIDAAANSNG